MCLIISLGADDFFKRPYRVGDRIEVNQKFGDVIDVGIF
jgi:small-conductance mechanosensitive channel